MENLLTRRRRRRHLEIEVNIQAGNYQYRSSYAFGVVVRDIGERRLEFYTEFRCASHEHSGLPWGAIFDKMSKFQEMHTF